MGQVELKNVLALAEQEEADEVTAATDTDPLSFRWNSPLQ